MPNSIRIVKGGFTVKKNIFFSSIFIFILFLSACSLEEDVATLYKKEIPLELEIIIPETFAANKQETIKVILTQDGKKVKGADDVRFEIWKQDGSVKFNKEQVLEEGNGVYSLSMTFDSDGLYYIKVHARNNGSEIMPQKQFVVGNLSETDLNFLKQGSQKQEGTHENHH